MSEENKIVDVPMDKVLEMAPRAFAAGGKVSARFTLGFLGADGKLLKTIDCHATDIKEVKDGEGL